MPVPSYLKKKLQQAVFCLLPSFMMICASAGLASAGDDAKLEIFGFSKHGDFFAFEQYGFQDGSGYPYSDIFVIDVLGDSWVKPSPFRRIDEMEYLEGTDEYAYLTDTRARNFGAADKLLEMKGIAGRGQTVAFNPRTELGSNPHKMVVAPRLPLLSGETSVELTLSEFPLQNAQCTAYDVESKGFRLTMVNNGVTRTLNHDTTLPKSRVCPTSYRMERFFTYYPESAPPVFAVLIQMESLGFEGPDRRYLAIAGRL
ncbi:DUF2259 domain-containing protein [Roseibium sp. HPY-6]|uniref:DUF2259 domain-containing protein n=1 Tax=Roseibium sp. HPY-6 TaxID=3229852 RepID=UPI00338F4304